MSQFLKIFSFLRQHILELLACVFFLLILVSTWFFLKKKENFPEMIHLAIQEEFQKVVKDKILEKNPLAKDIKFYELWTETTDDSSQIRAVFSYSFNDPTEPEDEITVTVKGSALINRQLSSTTDEIERWEIGSFDVDQTEMNFNNELLIISPKENLEFSEEE